jgi:hypothetical protein
MKDILSFLNESIEVNEASLGDWFYKQFNSKEINKRVSALAAKIKEYEKLFNRYKKDMGATGSFETDLKRLLNYLEEVKKGARIKDTAFNTIFKSLDRKLENAGLLARERQRAEDEAKIRAQKYNDELARKEAAKDSKKDNYETSDGISHFGNGDAHRA